MRDASNGADVPDVAASCTIFNAGKLSRLSLLTAPYTSSARLTVVLIDPAQARSVAELVGVAGVDADNAIQFGQLRGQSRDGPGPANFEVDPDVTCVAVARAVGLLLDLEI